MRSRRLLLDFGIRDVPFICRSCLSASQNQALPARVRWPRSIRPSSHAAQPQAQRKHDRPTDSSTTADQEAERRKTLQALGLLNQKENVTVNYFEEGDFGRRRRLGDRDDFGTSLADPGGIVDARLDGLEQQLEQARALVKKLEEIIREGVQDEQVPDRLSTLTGQEAPESGDNLEVRGREHLLISTEGWMTHQKDRIFSLNNTLRLAAHQLGEGAVKARTLNRLWGLYSLARPVLSTRWETVSAPIWQLLWGVFATESESNPNRMSHIYYLSKDMRSAGIRLTDDQQLLALEAMFISGWKKEAIENHKRLVTTLGAKPETFTKYWELGVRMYCLMGDVKRAQRSVARIVESPYSKDPRILLPLIRAYAADPAEVETAYQTYRQLRSLLDASMTIEDYDQIIGFFLAPGQTEHALRIFVEMMTSGSIDSPGRARSPPNTANPFFLGKWLKRLIGHGDLTGAYNVLLHMKKKGVVAHAIQVNGLLGAWLRSEIADNIRQAEDVGWAMIDSRIRFVQDRRRVSHLQRPDSLQPARDEWPLATMETFSLLADSYRSRRIHDKMEELWAAFREAEMPPDTFMMNQLLFSYIQDGQGKHVPSLCQDLSRKYGLKADPWTFMALWQSLPINRLWTVRGKHHPNERPRGRALFAEMIESAPIFAADGVDPNLGRTVLHSFRKVRDYVGLLAAVRGLRHVFNFLPSESVIFELLLGSMDLEKSLQRDGFRARLLSQAGSFQSYLTHRRRELIETGALDESVDELPEDVKREELCDFLELNLESRYQNCGMYPEGWEEALEQALREMGLYKEQTEGEATPEAPLKVRYS
ncbi:hypothetical protein DL764_002806 [Monosporascus ibericus]|uniref:Pentatricopeptide repeat domain-containing protein n=1 Tax=Monosporascus ibericus TaxID=155417 RepID=A0A4Q4TNQ7_9PEZI|nr:hypothetical protein DL764_002806 [Monosporascus ibericus]